MHFYVFLSFLLRTGRRVVKIYGFFKENEGARFHEYSNISFRGNSRAGGGVFALLFVFVIAFFTIR